MTADIKKPVTFFILVAYIFLLCFAIIFYFERLNSDAGYYFFHIVNTQWFHVEHGRLVLILAEILPTLGSILHLPLKILAILYSLNHVLFSGLLTWACLKRYRNLNAAILITALQFAGLRFSVFTPQFELYYGLSLLVFAMAYLQFTDTQKPKWSIVNHIEYGLLLVFIFTSHPMAIYCYFTCTLLFHSSKRNTLPILHSILFLVLYLVWKKISISPYEQSKFANLSNAFNDNFVHHYLNLSFLVKGLTFLIRYYADVLLLFIIGLVSLLKSKLYKASTFYFISVSGTLMVTWVMFEPDAIGRYIEQVYFPFVFISCLWLLRCNLNMKVLFCLSVMVLYRAFLITDTSFDYRERTNQMAKFTEAAQKQMGTKFYVNETQMGTKLYEQGNWSFGFETMFYSAMHCNKTVTITKSEDIEYKDNQHQLKPSDFLFRPYDIMPIQSLNQQYFKITNGDYLLLDVE